MSLGPQGGRGLLATMWRLAIARQQLLLVALAMVLLEGSAVAAAIGALERADTFASFASAFFEETKTLADALDRAAGGDAACAVAIAVYVLARPWPLAWLRASYIRALATTGGLPRPAWTSVIRLVLLDVCVLTPVAFIIGLLEKGDVAQFGLPLLLAVLALTLYADYAIVIDDLGILAAVRASVHVLLRRPAASLGVTAGSLTLSVILAESLGPSFDSGATPLTLLAYLVGSGALIFLSDVCLITLYRATAPPPEPGQDAI
jgi:hypothetical protein